MLLAVKFDVNESIGVICGVFKRNTHKTKLYMDKLTKTL